MNSKVAILTLISFQELSSNTAAVDSRQFVLSSQLAAALAFKKNGWTQFMINFSVVPLYPQSLAAIVMYLQGWQAPSDRNFNRF